MNGPQLLLQILAVLVGDQERRTRNRVLGYWGWVVDPHVCWSSWIEVILWMRTKMNSPVQMPSCNLLPPLSTHRRPCQPERIAPEAGAHRKQGNSLTMVDYIIITATLTDFRSSTSNPWRSHSVTDRLPHPATSLVLWRSVSHPRSRFI